MNPNLHKKIFLHSHLTPDTQKFFVDLDQVEQNFKNIQKVAPTNLSFIFPVKSFPHEKFLNTVAPFLKGFELSNKNEFDLIKDIISPQTNLFLSNVFQVNEAFMTHRNQITFDIGYLEQVLLTQQFRHLSLRIRPPQKLYQGEKTRYGLTQAELATLAKDEEFVQKVKMLHFHLGFERTSLNDLMLCIEYLEELKSLHFPNVHTFNIGGGISPLPSEDLRTLFKYISKCDTKFMIEAGRYFTENSCYAVGKILSVRQRDEVCEVVVNLSRECHLKWAAPKKFKILATTKKNGSYRYHGKIKVYGLTSYEGDTIIEANIEAGLALAPGDFMILDSISGYSIAWNHSFNGLPEATIVFV